MTNFVSQKLSQIHRRDRRVALLLALLCTLLWLPPMLGLVFGYYPLGEDALAFFVPMREFSHQAITQGVLPLWNPYSFCGIPFAANSQVAFWYPFNWLLGFLPSHWALIADLWFHTLLLSLGGFVLARSLGLSRTASFFVAVILLLASPITARAYAGHMTWQAARAYFPWMFWATWNCLHESKSVWWTRLTIFAALCVLAGHPPMFLLGFALCTLIILYFVVKNKVKKIAFAQSIPAALRTFSALCFALLLAACALLPMRELAAQTVHGSRLSYEESAVLSGTWKTIVRLFAPEWFGGNRGFQWSQACCAHEESAYIGVLPILLAILAPWILWPLKNTRLRVLALWWLLPFSLLMALGANGPLYRIVWLLVPPLQMTRVPVRWLEILYFAGALLAGLAFRTVFENYKNRDSLEYSQRNLKLLNGAFFALLFCFGAAAAFVILSNAGGGFWTGAAQFVGHSASPAKLQEAISNFRNAALFESLTVVILCGIALSLLSRWQRADATARIRLKKVLLGFVALDLLLLGWRSAKPVSPEEQSAIRWPSGITAQYEDNQRWETSFYWLAINGAVPQNIRIANGYDPLGTKKFFDFASAAEGHKLWNAFYQPERRSALWSVAGVTHTVTQKNESESRLDTSGWLRVAGDGKWQLWKHDAPWPLFYATTRVVRVPQSAQLRVLETLAREPQNGNWLVVVTDKFADVKPTREAPSIQLQSQSINQAIFQTSASSTAILVRSESFFPGWRAWLNEKPAAIEPANYMFQAVKIPAGNARVRFVYEPQSVRLGIFVSLCALSFWIAMIVNLKNKNREGKDKL